MADRPPPSRPDPAPEPGPQPGPGSQPRHLPQGRRAVIGSWLEGPAAATRAEGD